MEIERRERSVSTYYFILLTADTYHQTAFTFPFSSQRLTHT